MPSRNTVHCMAAFGVSMELRNLEEVCFFTLSTLPTELTQLSTTRRIICPDYTADPFRIKARPVIVMDTSLSALWKLHSIPVFRLFRDVTLTANAVVTRQSRFDFDRCH
jgi:hypothetical protein